MIKRGVVRFAARLSFKPGAVEHGELGGCLRFALSFALEDKADEMAPLICDFLDRNVAQT